jgi:hypothetical protein
MPKLRLTIELVPASSWRSNLKNILPRALWLKVRREVIEKSGNICAICGAHGRLECHEVWEYDDNSHIQKLLGFLALCGQCHAVKHIGYTTLRRGGGSFSMENLIKHFMKVNNCDRIMFNKHYKQALKTLQKRSRYDWEIIFKKQKEEVFLRSR